MCVIYHLPAIPPRESKRAGESGRTRVSEKQKNESEVRQFLWFCDVLLQKKRLLSLSLKKEEGKTKRLYKMIRGTKVLVIIVFPFFFFLSFFFSVAD